MRSHLLINTLMLIFAIILGTFLFFDEVEQNGVKKLSDINADNINEITITHNIREIILNKTDSNWQMMKPIKIAANQFRIKTLLNLLNTRSHAQYQTKDLDLKKFGLDKPKTFISFNDFKVYFGIVNPVSKLRYVKVNNELHLIDDILYPLLSSQTGTMIARELLPAGSKINKLVLPEFTFTRDDNDLWQGSETISSDAVLELIHQWTHKQAFAVHDYNKRKSLGEIQVYLQNSKEPVRFTITDIDPWLIIAREDINIEYHFNLEDYDALLKPGTSKHSPEEDSDEARRVSPDEFINAIQSN